MMGTRSGDLDPGVLIYLLCEKAFDPQALEDLVDQHSGLLGVSGLSGDLRDLHKATRSNPKARLAIEMFCMSIAKQIAAMIAALDGVDAIIFTGGIGEHDPAVRSEICKHLGWIGVHIDEGRNRSSDDQISSSGSRCEVHALPSQDDEQIALHVGQLLPPRRSC